MLFEQARPLGAGSAQPAASRSLLANALVPALVAVLLTAPACSRQEEVELSGSVHDPSGSRIPHALVLVTDAAREVAEATTAGGDGSFRIAGLPASPSYRIEVQGPSGFEPDLQDLDLSADRHLEVVLEIAPIVEAIVISGPPPQQGSVRSSEPRRRVRVGGNVRRARLVHYVAPTFPADAENQGVGGTVQLEGVVGKEGRVVGLSTLNSIVDERLSSAASDAVLQWRYDPTLLNGQPVETVVTISVAFEIP
ncbi:MAG: TonB family protein [Acidobacteriia bacterium]|nr:TonB family protein [Terriglobia bacterium]